MLAHNGLDQRIRELLQSLDVDDVVRLSEVGATIRGWILDAPLPVELEKAVREGYRRFGDHVSVAVRSSATAEDLPEASFAGQQETFLNVQGEDAVIEAMRQVFASLFNDRAIAYRVHQGFDHSQVALSAGIQQMVRSDLGASGVMFTLDTDSGFRDVVFITASYGLGETVVQGAVNPDEFYLYKPAVRADRHAVLRRNLGAKSIKMVYGDAGAAERVRTVDVALADRQRFCLDDADLLELANRRSSSKSITVGRWISSGAKMAPPARSTSFRRDQRPSRAAAVARSSDTPSPSAPTSSPRAAASGSASAQAPPASSPIRRRWHAFSQATCSSLT
jgi:pyruvate,water dikinase